MSHEKMYTPTIDAHQHFWDVGRFVYPWMTRERPLLHRNFLPEDLKPLLVKQGVDRTVVVQAHPSLAESRWLLQLAEVHDWISGVVAWVDLTGSDLAKNLDELQRYRKFKGIRHPIEAEPEDTWMIRGDVLRNLMELERRNIPLDLVIFPRHLKYVPVLRERCPQLRLVIDHLAKPPIASGLIDQWAADIEVVAKLPGVWCKVSGMITEADVTNWAARDLEPYVKHAVAAFGFARLMFGSDWPVCILAGSYQQVVDSMKAALGPLTSKESARFWGENAIEFYRLAK